MSKKQAKINVKGLSTNDILNMDIWSLSNENLAIVTRRLVSSGNKRIRRLQAKGYDEYSFAIKGLTKKGGQPIFSVKGSYNPKTKKYDRNKLEHEMKRLRTFLNSQTSSVTGFEEVKNDISNKVGSFPDLETEKQFWKEYNKYVGEHKDALKNLRERKFDSRVIQRLLHQQRVVKSHSLKGAKSVLTKYLNSLYLENQKQQEREDALNLGVTNGIDILSSDKSKGKPEF